MPVNNACKEAGLETQADTEFGLSGFAYIQDENGKKYL